jgi:hypothetical protein
MVAFAPAGKRHDAGDHVDENDVTIRHVVGVMRRY